MKKVQTNPDFCEVPMSPLAGGPAPRTVRLTRALPVPKSSDSDPRAVLRRLPVEHRRRGDDMPRFRADFMPPLAMGCI